MLEWREDEVAGEFPLGGDALLRKIMPATPLDGQLFNAGPAKRPPSKELQSTLFQAQTPQQRRANEAFARSEAQKRGKPPTAVKKEKPQKAPISRAWVALLAFVVCGGIIFELLRLVFSGNGRGYFQ
ncbi:hypothetical protein LTR66_003853 [Elasticomyces elasticus]|nr:hypothetical protein LTR66_003853 [Elasticomyces elasticus]